MTQGMLGGIGQEMTGRGAETTTTEIGTEVVTMTKTGTETMTNTEIETETETMIGIEIITDTTMNTEGLKTQGLRLKDTQFFKKVLKAAKIEKTRSKGKSWLRMKTTTALGNFTNSKSLKLNFT